MLGNKLMNPKGFFQKLSGPGPIGPVVLAYLMVTACSGGPSPNTAPAPTPATRYRPTGQSSERLEEIYQAREDSARMRFTEADVRFMTGMIVHHAQALVMSQLAPSHEAGSSISVLTARIINAQNDEIATMQNWLAERDLPVPQIEIDGTRLLVNGSEDVPMMHGMLTAGQMAELDAARGAEFDRLFLAFMIQHHQGAVHMVHELFATDGAAQGDVAFKLASDIQVDQLTEIARMELMLEQMSSGNN